MFVAFYNIVCICAGIWYIGHACIRESEARNSCYLYTLQDTFSVFIGSFILSFPFLHSIASFFRRTNVQLQQTDIHSLEGDSFFCGDVKVLVIRLLLFFSYQVFVKAASYRVY